MVIAIAPAEIFIDFLLGASTFAERLVREQIVKLLPEWISSQAVLILVCVAILWCDQSLNHEHWGILSEAGLQVWVGVGEFYVLYFNSYWGHLVNHKHRLNPFEFLVDLQLREVGVAIGVGGVFFGILDRA